MDTKRLVERYKAEAWDGENDTYAKTCPACGLEMWTACDRPTCPACGVALVTEADEGDKVTKAIIALFSKGAPDDKKVHALADKLSVNPHKLEGQIYGLLSAFLAQGKSKDFDGEYDEDELAKGVKVEMEHTSSKLIATRIAKDHLAEIPDYYTRLDKMEKAAKNESLTEKKQSKFARTVSSIQRKWKKSGGPSGSKRGGKYKTSAEKARALAAWIGSRTKPHKFAGHKPYGKGK